MKIVGNHVLKERGFRSLVYLTAYLRMFTLATYVRTIITYYTQIAKDSKEASWYLLWKEDSEVARYVLYSSL